MVRVVLLAFLVALFSMSCAQGSVGKSPELSPEGMLEQAHRALLELEYCKFALSHSGDGTELFPGVCLLYTSPSPRDGLLSRMPSSA